MQMLHLNKVVWKLGWTYKKSSKYEGYVKNPDLCDLNQLTSYSCVKFREAGASQKNCRWAVLFLYWDDVWNFINFYETLFHFRDSIINCTLE